MIRNEFHMQKCEHYSPELNFPPVFMLRRVQVEISPTNVDSVLYPLPVLTFNEGFQGHADFSLSLGGGIDVPYSPINARDGTSTKKQYPCMTSVAVAWVPLVR